MATQRSTRSRLARQETQKSYKRFLWASLGTIFLIVAIFFGGLPALIKLSAFLGELRSSTQPITSQNENSPLLPPRLEPLPDATKSPQINLRGFAQAGKEVEIFLNDESFGKTTADADGKFLFSNLSLSEGENRIRVYTVSGDQKSEASRTLFITYKKTAPKLEITKPEEGTTFRENDKTIRIEGQSDPNVSVTVNGRWAIVASDGKFFVSYTLNDGENVLKVVARDAAGNETTLERKLTYSP